MKDQRFIVLARLDNSIGDPSFHGKHPFVPIRHLDKPTELVADFPKARIKGVLDRLAAALVDGGASVWLQAIIRQVATLAAPDRFCDPLTPAQAMGLDLDGQADSVLCCRTGNGKIGDFYNATRVKVRSHRSWAMARAFVDAELRFWARS